MYAVEQVTRDVSDPLISSTYAVAQACRGGAKWALSPITSSNLIAHGFMNSLPIWSSLPVHLITNRWV